MPKDTLTITDNRTGKTYEVPIENGCIRTNDLRQIKVDDEDFGLMGYDPAFLNTANCRSAITFIDGDKGILEYRGYPIEQLAEKSTLPRGGLPAAERRAARRSKQLEEFIHLVTHHTYVHENIKTFMDGFRYDAHPMSMLASTVAALSGFYPDAKNIKDARSRRIQMIRHDREDAHHRGVQLTATRMGLPYVYPDNELSYVGNFLAMIKKIGTDTLQGEPGRWSARWTCSSSSTPTTSRTARTTADARWWAAPRWIRSRRSPPASPRSTARSTAAPTRPCCGCSARSATCRRSPSSSRR